MSGDATWSWDEMIAEFRRLGGVAENFRYGTGPFGRGLFAIDPTQPVRLQVPKRLLIPTDMLVAKGDRLEIRPEAPVEPATVIDQIAPKRRSRRAYAFRASFRCCFRNSGQNTSVTYSSA